MPIFIPFIGMSLVLWMHYLFSPIPNPSTRGGKGTVCVLFVSIEIHLRMIGLFQRHPSPAGERDGDRGTLGIQRTTRLISFPTQ